MMIRRPLPGSVPALAAMRPTGCREAPVSIQPGATRTTRTPFGRDLLGQALAGDRQPGRGAGIGGRHLGQRQTGLDRGDMDHHPRVPRDHAWHQRAIQPQGGRPVQGAPILRRQEPLLQPISRPVMRSPARPKVKLSKAGLPGKSLVTVARTTVFPARSVTPVGSAWWRYLALAANHRGSPAGRDGSGVRHGPRRWGVNAAANASPFCGARAAK